MIFDEMFIENRPVRRRDLLKLASAFGGAMLLGSAGKAFSQSKKKVSIATGGMGGTYFVIGGAIAGITAKYTGVEAAAEVTSTPAYNCRMISSKRSDLGLVTGDTGFDACNGRGIFKGQALPLRNVTALYPNLTHVVTLEGKGISNITDLKGKRVSTGTPGSSTETVAFRVLEAGGISHKKDITKERLGASDSARALLNGKIDAYFWSGGVPTASVLDLSNSPGARMALIASDNLLPKMAERYGPVYYKSFIPKNAYNGPARDTPVSTVPNLLMCHKDMDEKLVYNILGAIFGHLKELASVHKEALHINLKNGSSYRAVPYHAGAQRFFNEKGFKI